MTEHINSFVKLRLIAASIQMVNSQGEAISREIWGETTGVARHFDSNHNAVTPDFKKIKFLRENVVGAFTKLRGPA